MATTVSFASGMVRERQLIRRIAVDIEARSDFALCSDGKTVAVTGINLERGEGMMRQVAFHELATGRQVSRALWADHTDLPVLGGLTPDRRLLVIAAREGLLKLIPMTTGVGGARVAIENETVESVTFSGDRQRLAVASSLNDKSSFFRRFRVFALKNTNEFRLLAKFDLDCQHFTFSPDGSTLAISADGVKLIFLKVNSGKRQEFDNCFMREMAFSPDGHRIAGRRVGNDLAVWDSVTPRLLKLLEAPTSLTSAIALSSDGRIVAANGGPNVLHIWDATTGQRRARAWRRTRGPSQCSDCDA